MYKKKLHKTPSSANSQGGGAVKALADFSAKNSLFLSAP